ncbi:MAG: extracellular solute-binding protein [Oscillospiraceae bacterium]|nr:extracellular solute-binding protein [Oscillospiraceae bacterium]
MKRWITIGLILALCVGLLLYNMFGVTQPAEATATTPTTAQESSSEAPVTEPAPSEKDEPPTPETPPVTDTQILLRNGNAALQESWEKIAQDYKTATGVEVVILDETDERKATIYSVTEAAQVDSSVCQDLTGTAAWSQLADTGLTLTVDGKTCGIAAEAECFGLLYNKSLLAQVATPEEIYDIASFATVVNNLIQKGYTPFAGRGLGDGVALRLASIPGSIRDFAEIWVHAVDKSGDGSALERFLAGESVFYLGSTDEYDSIMAAGIDQLGILPIYQDEDESVNARQSLCVTAKSYWCVRNDVPEGQTQAAIDFLNYLLTSVEGTAPVDQLNLLAPYRSSGNWIKTVEGTGVTEGKALLVCQQLTKLPEGYIDAMNAYAADPTPENWEKVEQTRNS